MIVTVACGSTTSHKLTRNDVPEWYWHQQVNDPINPKNPGKGRSNFSTAEKQEIDRIMGDELTSLGYAPASAGKE